MAFSAWTSVAGETTLNGSMSSTQLTMTLTDGSVLLGPLTVEEGQELLVAVEDEIMLVKGIATNVATITRGYLGTTAATHADARAVHVLSKAALYKLVKAALLVTAPGS